MTYSNWIKSLTGAQLPTRSWSPNGIAGAIANPTEFAFFRDRLGERILRLWNALPAQRKVTLDKLANIGTADWPGPFSELVAADFFAAITPNVELEQLPELAVLGERVGRKRSQLDGKLPSYFDLHYEVKALTEVSSLVLDRVRGEIESEFPNIRVFFSFHFGQRTTDVARFRGDIKAAIREAVSKDARGLLHEESGVHVLIRSRAGGITTTEHHYNPFEQAANRHRQVLDKWYQLIEFAANLRVFVVHPWFNAANADPFGGAHDVFFRALSRRVFCQLTKDKSLLDTGASCIPSTMTIADVAQRVSGILFIVDRTLA